MVVGGGGGGVVVVVVRELSGKKMAPGDWNDASGSSKPASRGGGGGGGVGLGLAGLHNQEWKAWLQGSVPSHLEGIPEEGSGAGTTMLSGSLLLATTGSDKAPAGRDFALKIGGRMGRGSLTHCQAWRGSLHLS